MITRRPFLSFVSVNAIFRRRGPERRKRDREQKPGENQPALVSHHVWVLPAEYVTELRPQASGSGCLARSAIQVLRPSASFAATDIRISRLLPG